MQEIEIEIPQPALTGIMGIKRIQTVFKQDPVLKYVPQFEFPRQITIKPIKRVFAKYYRQIAHINYLHDKELRAEIIIGEEKEPPDHCWTLTYVAAYWQDHALGLPAECDKLAVALNSMEIQWIFLLNHLDKEADSGALKDSAELGYCASQVDYILQKAKEPIIETLKENNVPIPTTKT